MVDDDGDFLAIKALLIKMFVTIYDGCVSIISQVELIYSQTVRHLAGKPGRPAWWTTISSLVETK